MAGGGEKGRKENYQGDKQGKRRLCHGSQQNNSKIETIVTTCQHIGRDRERESGADAGGRTKGERQWDLHEREEGRESERAREGKGDSPWESKKTQTQQEGVGCDDGGGGGGGRRRGASSEALKILYLNAQSLGGKIDELACTTKVSEPDIILVTESWCNSEITDAFLTIPGYDLQQELRRDREDTAGGRGGGLLVYTRNGTRILPIDNKVQQSQYCKFTVKDIVIHLEYRSPSTKNSSIAELAEVIREAERNSIFIGDFNLPEINWQTGKTTTRSQVFLDAIEDSAMEQLVSFNTHIKGNLLDLVVTNIPERIMAVEEEGRLGKSDHVMILTSIAVGKGEPAPTAVRPDWAKADWNGMRKDLSELEWRTMMLNKNANEAWEIFKTKVDDLTEKYVPMRRRRNHNRPPWLSQNILRAIRRKKRMWLKAKKGNGMDDYRIEEKKVKNMIRNAKRNFEKRVAKGAQDQA